MPIICLDHFIQIFAYINDILISRVIAFAHHRYLAACKPSRPLRHRKNILLFYVLLSVGTASKVCLTSMPLLPDVCEYVSRSINCSDLTLLNLSLSKVIAWSLFVTLIAFAVVNMATKVICSSTKSPGINVPGTVSMYCAFLSLGEFYMVYRFVSLTRIRRLNKA
jgi:hypothetical protein